MAGREDCGRVFVSKSGGPLDAPSVRDLVRRWGTAAGVEGLTPHAIRRSCATGMIRGGASPAHVRDQLGHEGFGSLSSYVQLAAKDLREAIERFHPRERDGEGGGP